MGEVRAARFRFHLTRDGDLVKYAVTKKRLLAGLTSSRARQLVFVIAEETAEIFLARPLTRTVDRLGLSGVDVLYWRSDVL